MTASSVNPPQEMLTIDLPRHVAIIMDGNGRWAKQRHMPRVAGHKAGVNAARMAVEVCAKQGISALTLFAFSSENWNRPRKEVDLLMDLFITSLRNEAKAIHANNIRMQIIGDRAPFTDKLQQRIDEVESLTRDNTGMTLSVAVNYGGRWDIVQATRKLIEQGISSDDVNEDSFAQNVMMADLPAPDLFIRTGGERRISNFLLWQLAYTELYFSDELWPDFSEAALLDAFQDFSGRQRRFGRTAEQVGENA